MSESTPSRYNCPCCKLPLRMHLDGDEIILFCARGRCKCNAMNDGEKGGTAWEAFQKLVAQFELWEDSQVE
jgi:hypothetical protein